MAAVMLNRAVARVMVSMASRTGRSFVKQLKTQKDKILIDILYFEQLVNKMKMINVVQ